MNKRLYSEILDENKELKLYKKVCKEGKLQLSKNESKRQISYTKWKEYIISKIIDSMIKEKQQNPNLNVELYLYNYKFYLRNKKRQEENHKDEFPNALTFTYSIAVSFFVSLHFAQPNTEINYKDLVLQFMLFLSILIIITIFAISLCNHWTYSKMDLYEDIAEILDNETIDNIDKKANEKCMEMIE